MSYWMRWSTFRKCSFTLCIFCFAASNESWAAKRADDLMPGEAFVIIKVMGDVKALEFQRCQGTEHFVAERHPRGRLIRVKAGRYYVRRVATVYQAIKLPKPEPSEPSQTIAIREGVVNYIGDWKFFEEPTADDIRYDIELRFNLGTASRIVKKHRISQYGLMVSKRGEQPVKTELPATR